MRAWRVHRSGAPSEALQLDEVDEPVAGPGEVIVRTTATVCNFNEIDGCRGRYLTVNPPIPYILGMECTGVVESAGAGAEHWIGRRVVATSVGAFGAHAELAKCSADMTFDAPDALPGSDAAAFLFPFHLSWLGLFERGRVQAGETVLVTSRGRPVAQIQPPSRRTPEELEKAKQELLDFLRSQPTRNLKITWKRDELYDD
jgi:NADPH2:quinone reductase